jgi:hypothetical protein
MKIEVRKNTVPQSRVTDIQIPGPGGPWSFLAESAMIENNKDSMKKTFRV